MKTIKEIREISGLNRPDFSRKYHIPLRSIEDWEAGRRKCPDYLPLLLERAVSEDSAPLCEIYQDKNLIKELGACYYKLLKTLSARKHGVKNPYPNADVFPIKYFNIILMQAIRKGIPDELNERIGLLMDFISLEDWANSINKPCPMEFRPFFELGMTSEKEKKL